MDFVAHSYQTEILQTRFLSSNIMNSAMINNEQYLVTSITVRFKDIKCQAQAEHFISDKARLQVL